MGYMADNANRFFHPAAIDEMLSRFIPQIGDSLDVGALFGPLESQPYLRQGYRVFYQLNIIFCLSCHCHILSLICPCYFDCGSP